MSCKRAGNHNYQFQQSYTWFILMADVSGPLEPNDSGEVCMYLLKQGGRRNWDKGVQRAPLTRPLRHEGLLSALDALAHLEDGEGSEIIVGCQRHNFWQPLNFKQMNTQPRNLWTVKKTTVEQTINTLRPAPVFLACVQQCRTLAANNTASCAPFWPRKFKKQANKQKMTEHYIINFSLAMRRVSSSSNLMSDLSRRTRPRWWTTMRANQIHSWLQLQRKYESTRSRLNKPRIWNRPLRSATLAFLLEPEENGTQPIKHCWLHWSLGKQTRLGCQVLVDKSHSPLSTSWISSQAQDRQVAKAPSWPKTSSWASHISWCHQETWSGLDRTPKRGSALRSWARVISEGGFVSIVFCCSWEMSSCKWIT